MKIKSTSSNIVIYLIIIIGAIIFLFPLYLLIVWSFQSTNEIFSFPPKLIPSSNFIENFNMLQIKMDVYKTIFNSVLITTITVIGQLFFASLAGFAFAKYAFKGKTILFTLLIATMTIPFQATVIPLYIMMQKLNLGNTYASVILPGLTPAFGVFLMRQSIKQIVHDDLIDAGRLDGATEFGIYFRIVLPVLKPTLAALGMIFSLGAWNNFFWPLIILRTPDMLTITVALANIVGVYERPYGALMLGSFISLLPILILFLFLQKHFIRGLTVGSFR